MAVGPKSHDVHEVHKVTCTSPEQAGEWTEWLLKNGAKSVDVWVEFGYWFVRGETPVTTKSSD